jgi:bifunctional DNase/RNase
MTHDLLRDVLSTLDVHVGRVEITELVAGVFHAALVLDGGRRVDARASDAIALAVRVGCPVLCATEVLAEVGIEAAPVSAEEAEEAAASSSPDEQVAQFREFLDHVSPDDFERGEPGGKDRGSTSGGG